MASRILVTGSRRWDDGACVEQALDAAWEALGRRPDVTLVTGACPTGADAIAESAWRARGLPVERHLADWTRHGRSAGPRRNAEMVRLGADVCLAFIRDFSMGASRTASLAESVGIPVRRFTTVSPARHDEPAVEAAGDSPPRLF